MGRDIAVGSFRTNRRMLLILSLNVKLHFQEIKFWQNCSQGAAKFHPPLLISRAL